MDTDIDRKFEPCFATDFAYVANGAGRGLILRLQKLGFLRRGPAGGVLTSGVCILLSAQMWRNFRRGNSYSSSWLLLLMNADADPNSPVAPYRDCYRPVS